MIDWYFVKTDVIESFFLGFTICSESIIGEEELLQGKRSGSMVWVGSITLIVSKASWQYKVATLYNLLFQRRNLSCSVFLFALLPKHPPHLHKVNPFLA